MPSGRGSSVPPAYANDPPHSVTLASSGDLAARAYAFFVHVLELAMEGREPGPAEAEEFEAIAREPGGVEALGKALDDVNAAFDPIWTDVKPTPEEVKAARGVARTLIAATKHRPQGTPALRTPVVATRGTSRESRRSRSRATRASPSGDPDEPDLDQPRAPGGAR